MALRKRKKKSRQQSQNAIMNWIVLFLIAGAAIQNFGTRLMNPDAQRDENSKSSINLPSYEQLKEARSRILPTAGDNILTTQELEPGTGAPASCGQHVIIAFTSFDEADVPLTDSATRESPLHFTIGQKKIMPALEEGVTGMKPGGKRTVFAPAGMAYGAEGYEKSGMPSEGRVRFAIELLEASPKLPSPEASSFRFFDTGTGSGAELSCGETTTAAITIWATSGEKLFPKGEEKTATIRLTPGSGEQFLGLEQAALGLRSGGTRSAIVPPEYQKILNEGAGTLAIPFPKDQTVLVDIALVQE